MLPSFRNIIMTRLFFTFAVQGQAVLMGWQVYSLTKDPLYLGLIGLTEAIPALGLALFAGDFVDRHNPHRVYQNVLRISLLSAVILVAASLPMLALSDPARVGLIYVAAFLTGLGRAFSGPSMYSVIPRVVPRDTWTTSSAWVTGVFQIATICGPALAGLLYAWQGAIVPYALNCALLILGLATWGRVAYRHVPNAAAIAEKGIQRFTSGLKFVFSHPLLFSALALDMFAVLFGGVTAILPVFAAEILHTGPVGLGFLRAASAVGALVMSLYLVRFPIKRQAGMILLVAVAGYGFCMIGFGLSTTFWVSFALLALGGALDSISMVTRGAIVQLSSPEHMRGRVSAVNSIFIGSSNELGAFESGLAAKLLGTVPSVLLGGTVTLVTVTVIAALAPALRKMDIRHLEAQGK
ncbi:MAG: MFS transporter [Bacteriovoracia bacterium]